MTEQQDAAKGQRKKDPETLQMREHFQRIFYELTEYRAKLARELEDARAEEPPYRHLINALERQLGEIDAFERLLEDQVLPEIIKLANTSGWVSHARRRTFF